MLIGENQTNKRPCINGDMRFFSKYSKIVMFLFGSL